MRRRRRRRSLDPTVWVVMTGGGPKDDLRIAGVTGTRDEADAMVEEITRWPPGRFTIWEQDALLACPGTDKSAGILPGEQRAAFLILHDHEWLDATLSREVAQTALRTWLARGYVGATVREVVTNTWLIDPGRGPEPTPRG